MNREKELIKLIPSLFSFAYALLPDDLQAQQLVIDAQARILEQNQADYKTVGDLEQKVLTAIYEIAKKRVAHFMPMVPESGHNIFYSLSLPKRAALFLSRKDGQDLLSIASIIGEEQDVAERILISAKENLRLHQSQDNQGVSI